VFINRHAGEAVLKGAQVYSPGLLAASPGLVEGDLVAVAVALEQQAGCAAAALVLVLDSRV
jgi:predicted ribosome-associated RNA-binding protein Tma20